MKEPKAKKTGRKAGTLKIQGDWRDAVRKTLRKKTPKMGLLKHKPK